MSETKNINLTNVVLSSKPCPKCVEASGRSMTYQEWIASEWGLPGSSGRYCEANCHCILVPEDQLHKLPNIGKRVKLRGDAGSDIKPVVEVGPNEEELKVLMDTWNAKIGVLPKKLYTLSVEEAIPWLRDELIRTLARLKLGGL